MSLLSRSIVAVMAGFALVGLAACGGGATGGTTTPPPQPTTGLANLDPCKIMPAQQLTSDGFQTQGAPDHDLTEEPGCAFKGNNGNDIRLTFFKNQTKTVDTYQTDGSWDDYAKTTVNGRAAARAQGTGVKGNGGCTILMNAGGGVVNVQVTDLGKSDDQVCGEAMKYAQQVEPSLPK